MMWHVLKNLYDKNPLVKRKIFVDGKPRWEDVQAKRFIEDALSKSMKHEDFNDFVFSHITHSAMSTRFVQWMNISDSDLKSPEDSLEISLARVKGARRGGELPVLYETLKPDQSFEAELLKVESRFSEKEILKIAHDFYLRVAAHDRIDVPKEPYLLRLGQGSTAYSTSLLILAEELGIKNYRVAPPRTRKRIDDSLPLGFVRLSL